MRIRQIGAGDPARCGIALFARTLEAELRRQGFEIETVDTLERDSGADLVLLHHHPELFADADVFALARACLRPFVLFAHAGIDARLAEAAHATVTMAREMIDGAAIPLHVMRHPAWTPPALEDRAQLRAKFGLPHDAMILGTSGFLKLERRFPDLVAALLTEAAAHDWVVQLVTSPWRLESHGLLDALAALSRAHPGRFVHVHAHLDPPTLNRRLQACDLLWCWTDAPSEPYASGVASDHYASGTRMVIAKKRQHAHVLALPNVVCAPGALEPFVDALIAEARRGERRRHAPAPIAWDAEAAALANFLREVGGFSPD
jgi:hypothetical protein